MKSKLLGVLALSILIPALAQASFDPTGWLKGIKITTAAKPKPVAVVATSTGTTTPDSLVAGVAAASIFASKEKALNDQLSRLKTENDSLKKTIASLQKKIDSLITAQNNTVASYQKEIELTKNASSPENLAKIKNLEWQISAFIDNNHRYTIDMITGEMSSNKQTNVPYFRDAKNSDNFSSILKQYDSMNNTNLYDKFKFAFSSADDVAQDRFRDFYNYFLSVRKFPK